MCCTLGHFGNMNDDNVFSMCPVCNEYSFIERCGGFTGCINSECRFFSGMSKCYKIPSKYTKFVKKSPIKTKEVSDITKRCKIVKKPMIDEEEVTNFTDHSNKTDVQCR